MAIVYSKVEQGRTITVCDSTPVHSAVAGDTAIDITNGIFYIYTTSWQTGSFYEKQVAVSDETTALTTGTAKLTFRIPCAMKVTAIRASVTTAPTGADLLIGVNTSGGSIINDAIAPLRIDATEKTSVTAANQPQITTSTLNDDEEMIIDIDQVGSTYAGAGLKVTFIGYRL